MLRECNDAIILNLNWVYAGRLKNRRRNNGLAISRLEVKQEQQYSKLEI